MEANARTITELVEAKEAAAVARQQEGLAAISQMTQECVLQMQAKLQEQVDEKLGQAL